MKPERAATARIDLANAIAAMKPEWAIGEASTAAWKEFVRAFQSGEVDVVARSETSFINAEYTRGREEGYDAGRLFEAQRCAELCKDNDAQCIHAEIKRRIADISSTICTCYIHPLTGLASTKERREQCPVHSRVDKPRECCLKWDVLTNRCPDCPLSERATNAQSDTPRTDEEVEIAKKFPLTQHGLWVSAEHARQLERELAVMSELYAREGHAKMVLMEAGTRSSTSNLEAQGPCETTMTPRFKIKDCACGTYPDNLGPCLTWNEGGAVGRCVYCDHGLDCHVKLSKLAFSATAGWIPVSERMPEKFGLFVLAFKRERPVRVYRLHAGRWLVSRLRRPNRALPPALYHTLATAPSRAR